MVVSRFSKPKRDSKNKIEWYKARLVTKEFTQKKGTDYSKIFSPIFEKDSFKIFMALVTHYNLKLHQIGIKMTFLNGNLEEKIYINQPEGFEKKEKKNLVCKLNKSIYRLKQAS